MVARKKATRGKKVQSAKTAKSAKAAAPKKARATAKAKTTAKKAASAKTAVASLSNKPISQKQTKSQIYTEVASLANVSKNDAKNVVCALRCMIERHVKPKGSGIFTVPELGIRVRRVNKKASKARMGRNPFTGEEIQIPAKPARKSVKVSALRALKALIEE
jgi:nucleoid DNA-binding protein